MPLLVFLVLGLGFGHKAQAAAAIPGAALVNLGGVFVPNWTTSGANQASTDTFSFDRRTNTVYFADRVNRGVSAIDTRRLVYVGTITVPTCTGAPGTAPGSCPSGVLVAGDVEKLIVTDRNNAGPVDLSNIFIYNLRLPSVPPIMLTAAGGALDTDELEYDPVNKRAYVANSTCPCFLTVVDLNPTSGTVNTIIDQIPLPANLEQPRFNPIDGFIYQTMPDDAVTSTGGANDKVVRIDPTKAGGAAVVASIAPPSGCAVRGIDVDPVTNTGVVGCAGTATAQFLLNFSGSMSIVSTSLPTVGGTDTLGFNPNLRRWYLAQSNNTNSGVACAGTAEGTKHFPVVGTYAAAPVGSPANATMVGADCSGINGHGIGVDTVQNLIFSGIRQFPQDPASTTTGVARVEVWADFSPLGQNPLETASSTINPASGGTATGSVNWTDTRITASLANLPASGGVQLVVTSTYGIETVGCFRGSPSTTATCMERTAWDPLLGGVVDVAVGGVIVGQGTITGPATATTE